ncbi:MAG TPA: hypothetical protein VFU69_11850 [Ktedonobacterales bacterium]|nr:hypothetical protein [Ktedonobacterales bacterium]
MSADANTITQLYEQIPLEAMQQVADSYMTWYVDKATRQFDETIAKLRAELEENDKQEALFKPSAAELDAMRRLQANKVADVDLLDRLVGKGEEWLVLTMHRLDYFERAGLAPTDYPGWCEHALIGAYDWIDAPRLHASKRMFSLQGGGTGPMRAIRPSDLAAAASKKEPAVQLRAEAAPPARPAPAPQRAEPPAPKPPAPAPRAHEPAELSTQPVPSIAQPAPVAQEQIGKAETAPLPPPATRPEAPIRQAAPASQAPQRAPAASGGIPDTPTRPTPAAVPPQKATPPQQPAPGGQSAGGAGAPPAIQRRSEQLTQPPRPQQSAPAQAPRPQQPAAPSQQAQQPYAAAPKPQPRPSGGTGWGSQEQPRSDPRYSLDDVEVEDLEEEGEDQGLIRKIFRVFTG